MSLLLGHAFLPEMGIYAGWVVPRNSFGAGQPCFNEQRDIALLFSGEFFADPEMRIDLTRKGHELEEAVSAWIAHRYEEQGDRFFEKLNGLFSGLLIDKRQRKAFLFNDRYGLERIYWHDTKDATYFASEAKALLAVFLSFARSMKRVSHNISLLVARWGERTLFRGISLSPEALLALWTARSPERCRKSRAILLPRPVGGAGAADREQYRSRVSARHFSAVLPRYSEACARAWASPYWRARHPYGHGLSSGIRHTASLLYFVGESGLTLDAVLRREWPL